MFTYDSETNALQSFHTSTIGKFLPVGSLTPKTREKSPNNIDIGPNFTYSVSRGLVTGLAVTKVQ